MEKFIVQQRELMYQFENIDEALEIEATSIVKEPVIDKNKSIQKIQNQVPLNYSDKDFEYTRVNLYSLIEKGQEAINDIMELANQSQSPRAYEVAFQGIKNVADMTDKLIDLQQKMKKLNDSEVKSPSTVNNTMFVGSTADLQKLLKQGFIDNK
jgi:hypothetical protein